MIAQERWLVAWPLVAGVALAGLWPLTAYAVSPYLLPAVLVVVLVAAAVFRRPEYGIATVIALAPWVNMRFGGSGGLADTEKVLHLIVPALAFGVLAYTLLVSRPEGDGRSRWLTVSILLFVVVALASSMLALQPSSSVSKVVILLTATAVFLSITQACRERRQLLVVAGGAVLALLLAGTQGVLQHYSGDFGQFGFVADGSVVKRVQGSFGHPNQYGGFIAVLIPVAIAALVTRAVPTALRWLSAAALGTALLGLVFSYARGAIAALVLGSLIWLAFMRPRLAALVTVVVAVAAIALAPAALKERFDPQGASGDVPLRADIWTSAVDIYTAHPVLGVGVDNFGNAYAELPSTLSTASQRRLLHQEQLLTPPHAQNQYLNILAEEGLIGLSAFALLAIAVIGAARRGSNVADPIGRNICLGIGAGLMTLAVHSMLDVNLFGEVAMPLFALVGVAAGFAALDERETEKPA
jgi:O-antigen ligase